MRVIKNCVFHLDVAQDVLQWHSILSIIPKTSIETARPSSHQRKKRMTQ